MTLLGFCFSLGSTTVTKTYDTNGTYIVNLTVFDDEWSQTDLETIKVKKLFDITFLVKDNSTKSNINQAKVKFNSILKNTSSDGTVKFTVPEGEHSFVVEKTKIPSSK